ncbi:MAG: DUF2283 domain-containing protein [Methanobrevibacter sp.]|jgi:uncharacterized protein YuzE|nr:DUF2283 domain-containing protein [Candidatus Methanoflexus mossambicus]
MNNKLNSINYKYDDTVDALMIKVNNYAHESTVPLTDDIIMDLNKKDEFIGLEILDASKLLDASPESLKNIIAIDLIVKVTNYQIFISAIFTLPIHNHEEIKVANTTLINDINIPLMDKKLVTAV